MKRLVFATGGTGGHIFPALAIATEAKKRGYDCHFIGQEQGMEARLIPEQFPFIGVAAGKLDRQRPNPLAVLRNVKGVIEAIGALRKLEPALVIGFGGFASFPALAAARLLGKPYVLHETNAYPGLVTRLFARGAKLVLASQNSTFDHLPKTLSAHVVGHPVKEEYVDKVTARAQLGLPQDALITYVTGGSQGSLFLNTHVPDAFTGLSSQMPHAVLHSTGKRWLADVEKGSAGLMNYFTKDFVNATLAWSAADLAICRAGYGTLSEAAFHGVPCIMIPLPTAAENHQFHNAQAFARAGAGWVMEENQIGSLAMMWQEKLNIQTLSEASQAALKLSPKGASTTFMKLIDSYFQLSNGASLGSAA
ncbi:MAG: undecaprenyldiphospho-muramoylpentapeptide beta-N-acetylglucosaminyltransferase [Trueperaceae bacterium]|nr:undecaprenyldiphospho-muramoylpentapeptide beta-N-acetylglucosaminyltransferase [Trueperaceae bacterium]